MVKRKRPATHRDESNSGPRLKFKPSTPPPTREESATPSTTSDKPQASDRLAAANLPQKDVPEYAVNTQVLCQYAGSFHYDAKIIKVHQNEEGTTLYTIHYSGWNSRYDEIITHEDAVEKFLPYTKENIERAKKEVTDAKRNTKRSRNPKGSKNSSVVPSKKNRSTTPARTNTSARNTPVDLGGVTTPLQTGTYTSILSDASNHLVSNVHPQKVEVKFPDDLLEILIKDAEMVNENNSKLVKLPASVTVEQILADYKDSGRNPFSSIPYSNGTLDNSLDSLQTSFCQSLSTTGIFKFEVNQFLEILNKKRIDLGYGEVNLNLYRMSLADDGQGKNETFESEASESKDDTALTMRQTRSKRHSKAESEKRVSVRKELNNGPLKDEDISYQTVYGFVHFLRFLHQLNSGENFSLPYQCINFYAPLIGDLLEFLSSKKNEYYKMETDYETPSRAYKANQN